MENSLFLITLRRKFPAILILIFCWSLIYLPNLGLAPLAGFESKRVSIAFDIVDLSGLFSADYIGEFYSNKPPIYSFLLSIFLKLINSSIEFAVRLPSALCVLFTAIISLYKLAWIKNNASFFISLLLILSPISIYYGRLAELEIFYAALIYLSFTDCIKFFFKNNNNNLLISASILQGIAFIIKGPIGIFMLLVFIIFKSNSLQEIIKVFKIIFPYFFIICIGYFLVPLALGAMSTRILLQEIYVRFFWSFSLRRFFCERLLALSLALVPSFIALNNWNVINKNFSFIYKYCSSLLLLFFLIPGFQADYLAPALILVIIPSGITLSNLLSSKNYIKVWPLLLSLLFVGNISSLILPNYANKQSNISQAKSVILDGLKNVNYSSNLFPKRILLTNRAKYIAPYLYNAKEKFVLKTLSSENLKNELYKTPSNKFFLISEKNKSENNKLINSEKKSCEIKEISKTYLIRDIFGWQNLGDFQIRENYMLYEVSKCLDAL